MSIIGSEKFKLDNLLKYRTKARVEEHWDIIHRIEHYIEKVVRAKASGDILVRFYDIDFNNSVVDVNFFISSNKEVPSTDIFKYIEKIELVGSEGKEYLDKYETLIDYFKNNLLEMPIDVVIRYENEVIKIFIFESGYSS